MLITPYRSPISDRRPAPSLCQVLTSKSLLTGRLVAVCSFIDHSIIIRLPVCKTRYQSMNGTLIFVLYIPTVLNTSSLLPLLNQVALKAEIYIPAYENNLSNKMFENCILNLVQAQYNTNSLLYKL